VLVAARLGQMGVELVLSQAGEARASCSFQSRANIVSGLDAALFRSRDRAIR